MTEAAAASDPVRTNPALYRVILENDRVRVLEYLDSPGDRTTPHSHPDSVMLTLSSFRRRLASGDHEVEVDLPIHEARWLDAQEHSGMNVGTTPTHTIFVELKEPEPDPLHALVWAPDDLTARSGRTLTKFGDVHHDRDGWLGTRSRSGSCHRPRGRPDGRVTWDRAASSG